MAGKLEAAVSKFDKALADVKAQIAEQRKAVEDAEAHVDSAVSDFENEGGTPVAEAPAEATPQEAPYSPPVV